MVPFFFFVDLVLLSAVSVFLAATATTTTKPISGFFSDCCDFVVSSGKEIGISLSCRVHSLELAVQFLFLLLDSCWEVTVSFMWSCWSSKARRVLLVEVAPLAVPMLFLRFLGFNGQNCLLRRDQSLWLRRVLRQAWTSMPLLLMFGCFTCLETGSPYRLVCGYWLFYSCFTFVCSRFGLSRVCNRSCLHQ